MSYRKVLRWTLIFIFISICPSLVYAKGYIEKNGDALQLLIPAVGLGSAIFYEQGNEGIVQFSKAFAASQLFTESLKITIHKSRPNGDCCKSFPSGHTSAAFMGAGFIHKRYGWEYAVPAYIGATYVGYSRVQAHKHYVEDVVAGALIGTLSSFYFTEQYNKGPSFVPIAGKDIHRINLSWSW